MSLNNPENTCDKLQIKRWDVTIPDAILDLEGLTHYEFMVYYVIKSYASKEGTCFPSLTTIEKRSKISRSKVIDCIAKLVELGLLKKVVRKKANGENDSNLYTVEDAYEVVSQKNGDSLPETPGSVPETLGGSIPETPGSVPETPEVIPNNFNHSFNFNQERKRKEEEEERAGATLYKFSEPLEEQTSKNNYYIAFQQYAGMLNLTPIQKQTCDFYIDTDKCEPEMLCAVIEQAALKSKYSTFPLFDKMMVTAINSGIRTKDAYVRWINNLEQSQAVGQYQQQNNRTYNNFPKPKQKRTGAEILREQMSVQNKSIYEIMREPF